MNIYIYSCVTEVFRLYRFIELELLGYLIGQLLMQASMGEYHSIRLKLAQLEKQMMAEVLRPERALLFMKPGRLVKYLSFPAYSR